MGTAKPGGCRDIPSDRADFFLSILYFALSTLSGDDRLEAAIKGEN